ncbi:unnamed protein product [Musa banksii]
MKTFDPWPVFFKREFNRNWPFLVGFAITGCIIVKMTAGLTGSSLNSPISSVFLSFPGFPSQSSRSDFFPLVLCLSDQIAEEDAKNSKFVQEHKRNLIILQPLEQFACPTPHPSLQRETNKDTDDKADCTYLTTRRH